MFLTLLLTLLEKGEYTESTKFINQAGIEVHVPDEMEPGGKTQLIQDLVFYVSCRKSFHLRLHGTLIGWGSTLRATLELALARVLAPIVRFSLMTFLNQLQYKYR